MANINREEMQAKYNIDLHDTETKMGLVTYNISKKIWEITVEGKTVPISDIEDFYTNFYPILKIDEEDIPTYVILAYEILELIDENLYEGYDRFDVLAALDFAKNRHLMELTKESIEMDQEEDESQEMDGVISVINDHKCNRCN